MRTAKSRVFIRHIIVLSLLVFLGWIASGYWQRLKAESATTTEALPTLRGEAALTHLKERGLYSSLSEAVKAARHNAQPLPPDVRSLLSQTSQLTAADGAGEDYFGAAVAISGNTAIIGAPRNDINGDADQGAAYIFVRSGGVWTQQEKLKAATGAAGDFFGGSVDISGDTAIVGACFNDVGGNANQGSVYVFTRSAGVWSQQQKLTASDGAANDLFGFSVAVDGDAAIIGSHLADAGVNANQGAVYVFTRGAGTWSQFQKLTAPDAAVGDLFGVSVALDAETAVIGASGKIETGDAGAGAAYVFTLLGGVWTGQQKLLPDISAAENFFGAAVAVSGDTVLIGSLGDDIGANVDQGSAVVFTRSGSTWTKQKKLTAAEGAAGDKFGSSVAISGDTALIGAIGEDFDEEDQGSAYVFSRSGTTWSQQPRLFAPDGEADDKFGAPVAISGDTVLVGASFDNIDGNTNQGSAHVFVICQGLAEQRKLTAGAGSEGDEFGMSVAISGDTAVVGSSLNDIGGNKWQGSAYIFVRNGSAWTQQQKLTATNGASEDMFGFSVAISGDTVVIGAIREDEGSNTDQGAAYIFVRNSTTWTQQQRITESDGGLYGLFGYAVAISGDTVIVGAGFHDVGANARQGAAYVYVRSGALWTPQQMLTAADGAFDDHFGITVAVNGDRAIVGAYYNDIGANSDQGSAYIFERSGSTWSQQQKIKASDGASDDRFGIAVAISADTAVVGASLKDGSNLIQGAAYVFDHDGTSWVERQKLTASDGGFNEQFGSSVAISGDTIVIGASQDTVNIGSQGSAYVFERGVTWTERQKLTASDGGFNDQFGATVAISGNTVVIGAHYADIGEANNQGAAYVFDCAFCSTITLEPTTLPDGVSGSPYSRRITATGGSGSYNYSVSSGALPSGLALDPTNGSLSGMPTAAGRYDLTITATDGSLCPGRRDYTLVIDCPVINVRPANPNLPPGQVGAPYAGDFTANGGLAPYSFSVSAGELPAGLTLDPATGVLSGAPTASGAFNFAIRATDSGGCSGETAYALTVNCPTIQINPANPNLPNVAAGAPFNATFTVMGGTAPYSFGITRGAAPRGLTLDAATGVLSGTPTATGEFSFEVRVTDGYGCSGSRAYVLTINCPQISIHPTRLEFPNIVFGTPFNLTLSTRGGAEVITSFAVESGSLPSGLTLDASTGVLSGTPTARGTFNFIIRATDGNGCIGRRTYQVVVN